MTHPAPIFIRDLDDARVAGFRDVRDRDLRRRDEGVFLVEGEVPLRVLLGQSRRKPLALLLSEPQATRLATLLPSVDVPTYVAPQSVVEAIVGFPIHRGVLALASRGPELDLGALDRARIVVALCGITNHDNVGGIFRNAAAFGADAVVIDAATCDPLYRKAVRVSVGGSIVVPYVQLGAEDEVVDALASRGFRCIALSPSGEAIVGRTPPPDGRVALLLGAEGAGLSARTLARCASARIEMAPGWDSLNVAAASAIALHWLTVAAR